MTSKTAKMDSYIDHEGPVAERYKWWGVYLVREKRRLQGIAQAVASDVPLAGNGEYDARPIPSIQLPEGVETPDELLTRVDAEIEMADALVELEEDKEEQQESKAHGSSVRDVETSIPEEVTRRKLSGRAALLGKKRPASDEDF